GVSKRVEAGGGVGGWGGGPQSGGGGRRGEGGVVVWQGREASPCGDACRGGRSRPGRLRSGGKAGSQGTRRNEGGLRNPGRGSSGVERPARIRLDAGSSPARDSGPEVAQWESGRHFTRLDAGSSPALGTR